jgi:formylglycine-generating enzyme
VFGIRRLAIIASFGFFLAPGCNRTTRDGIESTNVARARSTWRGAAASCSGLSLTCGPSKNEDCCTSLRVPGGTFLRTYDAVDFLDHTHPAAVSDFYLDRYEVTVARFRRFLDAGPATAQRAPAAGSATHPRIPGSGWNKAWDRGLPRDAAAAKALLKCNEHYQTWTDEAGGNENKPVNCVDWYTAFAFCAWDGGRLPTEAEWNYAAAAGNEQRYYPWSVPPASTLIDDSYAVYCGGSCQLLNVGAKSPKGDGKWGQADLGGNVWEWMLDLSDGTYPMPCHDCAELTRGDYRSFRSGSNDEIAATLRSAVRHIYYPDYRGLVGVRCARSP